MLQHSDILRIKEYYIKTRDGITLRACTAAAQAPRGTLFVLTGRTEYVEKYDQVRDFCLRQNMNVVVFDWRGQGLSDRVAQDVRLGHVHDFQDYQTDLDAVLDLAAAQGFSGPNYMLAHSMGGCIGLRRLMTTNDFAGAIFSAPMWGITYNRFLAPIARQVATVGCALGLSYNYAPGTGRQAYVLETDFSDNKLTDHRPSWDLLIQQVTDTPDLIIGGPSWHWLKQAEDEMYSLAQCASPNVASVVILGDCEEIVSPDRIKSRVACWDSGSLITVPNGKHETLMNAPSVSDDIMAQAFDAIGLDVI